MKKNLHEKKTPNKGKRRGRAAAPGRTEAEIAAETLFFAEAANFHGPEKFNKIVNRILLAPNKKSARSPAKWAAFSVFMKAALKAYIDDLRKRGQLEARLAERDEAARG